MFKAPSFNKKEEMFVLLCEYQVPVLRATWFIKLSSAYSVAVSEQKTKKRQLPDPTQGTNVIACPYVRLLNATANYCCTLCFAFVEWTSTLLKFMKEQLIKLQDYYQHTNQNPAALVPVGGGAAPADEQRLAMKQWQYFTLLAKHMYQVSRIRFRKSFA